MARKSWKGYARVLDSEPGSVYGTRSKEAATLYKALLKYEPYGIIKATVSVHEMRPPRCKSWRHYIDCVLASVAECFMRHKPEDLCIQVPREPGGLHSRCIYGFGMFLNPNNIAHRVFDRATMMARRLCVCEWLESLTLQVLLDRMGVKCLKHSIMRPDGVRPGEALLLIGKEIENLKTMGMEKEMILMSRDFQDLAVSVLNAAGIAVPAALRFSKSPSAILDCIYTVLLDSANRAALRVTNPVSAFPNSGKVGWMVLSDLLPRAHVNKFIQRRGGEIKCHI
ncbi:MAG: hypothetical protein ACYC64_13510 [Armatimonadota bacterium]